MIRTSEFSECGKFRYQLKRIWDERLPIVMCIGLNPSVAGKLKKDGTEQDDPTIRTLRKFLEAWGYGGLIMMNLYAIIESKSKNLVNYPDRLGDNDKWLLTTAYGVQEIIYCWGAFKGIEHRVKQVRAMFPDGKCFGKTSDGHPVHPMHLMWRGADPDNFTLTKF